MIEFAWIALFSWPLVTVALFRSLSLPLALISALLGGYLLLPSALSLDLPLLPPLHKNNIPALAALFCMMAFAGGSTAPVLPGWLPRDTVTRVLLVILLVGLVGTVVTNPDTLFYGPRVLRGLGPRDLISDTIRTALVLLPVLLARKVLAFPDAQRLLLLSVVIAMVLYSFLALYEVRMSPQLHNLFYGYFPSSFIQQMRAGGFRPLVFLRHGLVLGILLTCAIIAAAALWRLEKDTIRAQLGIAVVWLSATLVLAKSLGALLIALVMVPLALVLKPRGQLIFAAVIAGVVLSYPVLRSANLVPIGQIMDLAYSIDPARASSLGTRVQNETALMEKTAERPLFGWGGWGRNRIYNSWGGDISLTDGEGVIALSTGGWFRYIGVFGLLCLPIILLALKRGKDIDPVCAALALVLSAKLIDLLPNSGIDVIYLLMVGSLIGRLEMTSEAADRTENPDTGPPALGYARRELRDAVARPTAPQYRRFPPAKGKSAETPDRAADPYRRTPRAAYKRAAAKPERGK